MSFISYFVLLFGVLTKEKKKIRSNTEGEYNKALALDDPTKIPNDVQETLAREAIKKFKSL